MKARAVLAVAAVLTLAGCATGRPTTADSVSDCHHSVLAGAPSCAVTSGPDDGALVEPTGFDEHGRATTASTVRPPDRVRLSNR